MSATRREDNNRIHEKDDQEMEATVFNSQETPSGLFSLGELQTEENLKFNEKDKENSHTVVFTSYQ